MLARLRLALAPLVSSDAIKTSVQWYQTALPHGPGDLDG